MNSLESELGGWTLGPKQLLDLIEINLVFVAEEFLYV